MQTKTSMRDARPTTTSFHLLEHNTNKVLWEPH